MNKGKYLERNIGGGQCCGTGTGGTVTFCLSGTGTVIKGNHKRFPI
jgi:hypothetical protein